jgi:hypothetical protein
MAVLANLASGRTSCCVLYPSRGGFEGGGVGVFRSIVARVFTRGGTDERPYEAQQRAWRCPVTTRFHSVEDDVAVPEMASWWWGWPHRANGDGGDAPDVAAWPRASAKRTSVPLRGIHRTRVGGTVSQS